MQYLLGLTGARLSRSTFGPAEVTEVFDDVQANGRSLRRRSLFNLLDYQHATTVVGLFRDYMWRGERHVPVRWLQAGSFALVPSMSYRFSPVGPELQIKTRYKRGVNVGRVYARWTERVKPEDDRLVGVGGELERAARDRFGPRFAFDVWRNPDRTSGVRGEVSATFAPTANDRLVFSAALGAKGRGYLLGYPLESGAYASVGAGLRF